MTENGTAPEPQQGMLLQFFRDWQEAQRDVVMKEARFKGAAELVYGKDASWEYNEQTGLRFIQAKSSAS